MADKTHAATMLAAIEAVLEGRVTADVETYQISTGGITRQITKIPIPELKQLRDDYRAEVRAETAADNMAAGQGSGRGARVRF